MKLIFYKSLDGDPLTSTLKPNAGAYLLCKLVSDRRAVTLAPQTEGIETEGCSNMQSPVLGTFLLP